MAGRRPRLVKWSEFKKIKTRVDNIPPSRGAPTKYATKNELKKMGERVDKAIGVNMQIKGFNYDLDQAYIKIKMLENQIRSLQTQLDKVRKIAVERYYYRGSNGESSDEDQTKKEKKE